MQTMSKYTPHNKSRTQHVLQMPALQKDDNNDAFFTDNLEQLKALEYETRLRLSLSFLKRRQKVVQRKSHFSDTDPDLSFVSLPPEKTDQNTLSERLLKVEAENYRKAENSKLRG